MSLAGSGRPRTAGFDEYQALQMLDEGVVKRGVSDRKMRSFPEQPGATMPRSLLLFCPYSALCYSIGLFAHIFLQNRCQ